MTKPTDDKDGTANAGLFEDLAQPSAEQVQQAQAKTASKRSQGSPRLLQPNRLQVELRASDLESLLPQDHRARLVWGYVVRQDLSKLIEARPVATMPGAQRSTRASCFRFGCTPRCRVWTAGAR